MIKRIIVEGPDCSGKSSVVERVKNTLRWDSKSLHHLQGNQFDRYLKEYSINEKIVYDRSHFSEIVYSVLWRNGSPFSDEETKCLGFISKKDTLIIFACPDLDTMKKRYKCRNYPQQIKFGELEKSRNLFINLFKEVPVLVYYSRNYEELDKLVDEVKRRVV